PCIDRFRWELEGTHRNCTYQVKVRAKHGSKQLRRRQMGVHRLYVHEHPGAPRRHTDHGPSRPEAFAQIGRLPRTVLEVFLVDPLGQPHGYRFEVAPRQASVRIEPLVQDETLLTAARERLVVDGDEAADIDD